MPVASCATIRRESARQGAPGTEVAIFVASCATNRRESARQMPDLVASGEFVAPRATPPGDALDGAGGRFAWAAGVRALPRVAGGLKRDVSAGLRSVPGRSAAATERDRTVAGGLCVARAPALPGAPALRGHLRCRGICVAGAPALPGGAHGQPRRATGAIDPFASATRSSAASSISSPRRPADTWIVGKPAAEMSTTVGRARRVPSGLIPPST